MTKLVRDLMHKGLLTCRKDISLGEVASLLTGQHIHALIVADETGQPLGIISDFDLLAGEWLSVDKESLAAMRKLTAADLMTSPVDTIDANMTLKDAARTMLEKRVHRLMVTENDMPVGVISISDFVASIAREIKARRETVGDVMTDALLVCRNTAPIRSAAETMIQTRWRSMVVLDAKGKPQGVITGRGLMKFMKENGVDENLTAEDVMQPSLTTIDVNASLNEAANLMIQNHRHRLIVTDKREPDGFPLGIISSFDIVAAMARPGSVWQG